MPFPRERKRELRREAACVCSDQLGDTERAVQIFRGLFAEDPHDSVATASVTRLALLLEERGLYAEIAELWEQQAESRAASGSRAAAAALWTRAAEIWVNRLGDVERALTDYRQGAGLGGEQALEELARIHEGRGEHRLAAEALEWLCAQSSREALADRVLRLAEAYVATRQRGYARARLEWAAGTALDAAAVRRRLGELYREDGDWGPLAELLTAEAARAPDAKARLALLARGRATAPGKTPPAGCCRTAARAGSGPRARRSVAQARVVPRTRASRTLRRGERHLAQADRALRYAPPQGSSPGAFPARAGIAVRRAACGGHERTRGGQQD